MILTDSRFWILTNFLLQERRLLLPRRPLLPPPPRRRSPRRRRMTTWDSVSSTRISVSSTGISVFSTRTSSYNFGQKLSSFDQCLEGTPLSPLPQNKHVQLFVSGIVYFYYLSRDFIQIVDCFFISDRYRVYKLSVCMKGDYVSGEANQRIYNRRGQSGQREGSLRSVTSFWYLFKT